MATKKRGGPRPGAGRPRKATASDQWVIGAKLFNHIVRSARRRYFWKVDQHLFEGNRLAFEIGVLKETQRVARQRLLARGEGHRKISSFLKAGVLERQLEKVAAESELADASGKVLAPRKIPDGMRSAAIRAMTRLLRRRGIHISIDTVRHCLERYEAGSSRGFDDDD